MNNTNTDMNDAEKKIHKDGRSWEEVGPFPSFEKALEQKQLRERKMPDHDYKIKSLSSGFYLKMRLKESVLIEVQKMIDEEEKKKKEKKKLNKNRDTDLDNRRSKW